MNERLTTIFSKLQVTATEKESNMDVYEKELFGLARENVPAATLTNFMKAAGVNAAYRDTELGGGFDGAKDNLAVIVTGVGQAAAIWRVGGLGDLLERLTAELIESGQLPRREDVGDAGAGPPALSP